MWGRTRKALEKGFLEMYGRGGGGLEPYFFEYWSLPLAVWGFFACSGQVSDTLHPYPQYWVHFWGGGGEVQKSMFHRWLGQWENIPPSFSSFSLFKVTFRGELRAHVTDFVPKLPIFSPNPNPNPNQG